MNADTLLELQRLIGTFDSTDDLRVVSETVQDRWNQITYRAAEQFNEGDRVRFESRRGPQEGVITQVNRKTIKVRVEGRSHPLPGFHPPTTWKVSPNLLTKVQS